MYDFSNTKMLILEYLTAKHISLNTFSNNKPSFDKFHPLEDAQSGVFISHFLFLSSLSDQYLLISRLPLLFSHLTSSKIIAWPL